MRILVNPTANGGRARGRWAHVERGLRERGHGFEAVAPGSAEEAARSAREAVAAGCRTVVAAGGDGSVFGLVNALVDPERDAWPEGVAIGAIGLGSSNDFHKPFAPERTVAGVPVRLDPGAARAVDVGKATLTTAGGETRTRYFLLGASVGLVAEGNAFFNREGRLLAGLKRLHPEVAIVYSALASLLAYRPLGLDLSLDGGPGRRHAVTNLSVLKRVNLSGGMRYDTPVAPADGRFDVNLLERMGRLAIARAVADLYRGRFLGRPRAHHWRAARARVVPERPAALELDGEVTPIAAAELQVLPRALQVCG